MFKTSSVLTQNMPKKLIRMYTKWSPSSPVELLCHCFDPNSMYMASNLILLAE